MSKSAPAAIKLTIRVSRDTVPGYAQTNRMLPKPNTAKGAKTPVRYDFFSNATLQAQLGIIALRLNRTAFQPWPLAIAQPTPCNPSWITTETAMMARNRT